MRHEYKKLKIYYYLIFGLVFLVVLSLAWFFTQSFLTINIQPKSANISIDNVPLVIKASGIAKKTLRPGKHTIRADASGYLGFQTEIELKRGVMKKFVITLNAAPEALGGGGLITMGNSLSESYYLGDNGKTVYRAILGLNDENKAILLENKQITPARISNVTELIWSPERDLSLMRKSNGDMNIFDYRKYDFVNQTDTLWGKYIGSVAWAPNSSEIAYYYKPPTGEQTLVFANTANSQYERVYNFADSGIINPVLKWSPDSQWLMVIPKNRDRSTNYIYLFNAYNRTMKKLTESGNQVDAVFSPDSKKIIYATYSIDPKETMPYALSIMNIDGDEKRSLGVRADLRKFAWFKDGKNALMVSYDEHASKDYIFKFNTETKAKSLAVNNIENGKIESLVLMDNDKIMMYSSQGKIYGLNTEVFN